MTPDEANSRARLIVRKQVERLRHAGFVRPDADTQAMTEVGVLMISAAIQAAYEAGAKVHEANEVRRRNQARPRP